MNQDEFLGSEYDNSPDLMGVHGFLAGLAKLPKEQQAEYTKRMMRSKRIVLIPNSSRIEMEGKSFLLPKEIGDGLIKKRLQMADTRFYIVKDIAGKNTIDIFQGTDNKAVGLGNLANQKLEKDNWFILSASVVRTAVNVDKETATFGEPANYVTNGEYELEAGQKKLIGLMSADCFDTRNTRLPFGYYKYESVKIIEPQVEIKMPFKFAYPAPAQSWIRVTFIGTSVIPY